MNASTIGLVPLPRCLGHASGPVDQLTGERPIRVPFWTGQRTGQRHDVEQPGQLTPVSGQISAFGPPTCLQARDKRWRRCPTDVANVTQGWAGQRELPVQEGCERPIGTIALDEDVALDQVAVNQRPVVVERSQRVHSRVDQLPEPLPNLGVEPAATVSVEQPLTEMASHTLGQPMFTQLNVQRRAGQPTRSRQLNARQPAQRIANHVTELGGVGIAGGSENGVERLAVDPRHHQRWLPGCAALRIGQQDLGNGHDTTNALVDELLPSDNGGAPWKPNRHPHVVRRPHLEHRVTGERWRPPEGSEARSADGPERGLDRASVDTAAGHVPERTGQAPSGPPARREYGVVVMAYGSRRYLRQAWHLVISLRRYSPTVPIALITDRPNDRLAAVADLVIRLDGPIVTDGQAKLDLDLYSPFGRTLYLDADSLVVRDIRPLFDRFGQSEFVVLGRSISAGYWYGEVTAMCALAGSDSLPKFNGGIFYFTRGASARAIFRKARELAGQYAALGYDTFNGGVADEPLLAIALAQQRIAAQPVDNSSVSLLGITSPLSINTLSGRASFDKKHRPVAPAVVHFAADFSARFRLVGSYYRRECLRLRVAHRAVPTWLANGLAQLIYGLPCVLAGVLLRWRATSDPAR